MKGLWSTQGHVFEDAAIPGSRVPAPQPAPPTLDHPGPHQTTPATADVICLTDSDPEAPAGSEPAGQSAAQALRAQKHPRSRQVPAQPKAPSPGLCSRYSMSKLGVCNRCSMSKAWCVQVPDPALPSQPPACGSFFTRFQKQLALCNIMGSNTQFLDTFLSSFNGTGNLKLVLECCSVLQQ